MILGTKVGSGTPNTKTEQNRTKDLLVKPAKGNRTKCQPSRRGENRKVVRRRRKWEGSSVVHNYREITPSML